MPAYTGSAPGASAGAGAARQSQDFDRTHSWLGPSWMSGAGPMPWIVSMGMLMPSSLQERLTWVEQGGMGMAGR